MPEYRFPFLTREMILVWVDRYHAVEKSTEYPDEAALAAGQRILQGELSATNLQLIFRWKMESYFHRFDWVQEFPSPNNEDQIQRALRVAVSANRNDMAARIAMDALCNLSGVKRPVASAFLTAIHPTLFTVIDQQAYKALGQQLPSSVTTDEYFHYLAFCRQKAGEFQVPLRDLDRALVQFGTQSKHLCASSS